MNRNLRQSEQMSGDLYRIFENVSGRTWSWFALGSILLSAFLFLTGRRNWAIFIGQWPPTLLTLALFFRLLQPSREPGEISGMRKAAEETKRGMGQSGGSTFGRSGGDLDQ